uniref:Armadillo repeat-containing protein 1 n=1 Tax=Plectus sambesii TaxID=2011161 RepID=A0A914VNY2_9BILA
MSVNEVTRSTLSAYRRIAQEKSRRPHLLKDSSFSSFLVYVMDDESYEVVRSALKILLLLTEEDDHASVVRQTFGIEQALGKLKTRDLSHEAKDLIASLESRISTPRQAAKIDNQQGQLRGVNSDRSNGKIEETSPNARPGGRFIAGAKARTITLQLDSLNDSARKTIETALLAIKGVISIYFDSASSRCIVRAKLGITSETIGLAILDTKVTTVRLIKKHDDGTEEEIELTSESAALELENRVHNALPDYLPETVGNEPPSPRSAARCVARVDQNYAKQQNSGWFGHVTSFLAHTLW